VTIIYPISIPATPGIKSLRMTPIAVNGVSQDQFTLIQQVQGYPGKRWEIEISMPIMVRADADNWISFLLQLDGQFGTFLFGDPAAKTPKGTNLGTPVVDGAAQSGKTLAIKGMGANETGAYLAGDYFNLGSTISSRLYKFVKDVDADGSGKATADIWPALQLIPADNETIVVNNPKGVFRLAANQMPYTINEALHYGVVIPALSVV